MTKLTFKPSFVFREEWFDDREYEKIEYWWGKIDDEFKDKDNFIQICRAIGKQITANKNITEIFFRMDTKVRDLKEMNMFVTELVKGCGNNASWPAIKLIWFHYCGILDDTVTALCTIKMPKLKECGFPHDRRDCFKALAKAPFLKQLKLLSMANCHLQGSSLLAIAKTDMPLLDWISIESNDLSTRSFLDFVKEAKRIGTKSKDFTIAASNNNIDKKKGEKAAKKRWKNLKLISLTDWIDYRERLQECQNDEHFLAEFPMAEGNPDFDPAYDADIGSHPHCRYCERCKCCTCLCSDSDTSYQRDSILRYGR